MPNFLISLVTTKSASTKCTTTAAGIPAPPCRESTLAGTPDGPHNRACRSDGSCLSLRSSRLRSDAVSRRHPDTEIPLPSDQW